MVKKYTPKNRTLEALRWVDTPGCRDEMACWFDDQGDAFVTDGPIALVCCEGSPYATRIPEGWWITYDGDEWNAIDHDSFIATYEEVSDG